MRGTALPRDARDRQISAARRHHHGRNLRDCARDGGRAARIPAGADRRGRSVSRSRVERRAVAGDIRQRVPGRHRQRPDCEADPPQFRLRLSRPRSAASGGRQHRARAAPDTAERRRCAAGHRRDGELRRQCATPMSVFAEDEEGLPAGLAAALRPSATASRGRQLGVAVVRQRRHQHAAPRRKKETPEEDMLQGMHRMADFMRVPNLHQPAAVTRKARPACC